MDFAVTRIVHQADAQGTLPPKGQGGKGRQKCAEDGQDIDVEGKAHFRKTPGSKYDSCEGSNSTFRTPEARRFDRDFGIVAVENSRQVRLSSTRGECAHLPVAGRVG